MVRRPVVVIMSGVSVVVVVVSLQASRRSAPTPTSSGVHAGAFVMPAATSTSPTAGPAATAAPTTLPTRAAARPHPRATSRPTVRPTIRARPRPTASPTPATVQVNGAPADTQYGPVQVRITLRGGHIVSAEAIDYPQGGGRDQEINSYAIPQLNDEAVQADSSQIDTVSGATYTSDGYRQSLQSALDAAHQAGAR